MLKCKKYDHLTHDYFANPRNQVEEKINYVDKDDDDKEVVWYFENEAINHVWQGRQNFHSSQKW